MRACDGWADVPPDGRRGSGFYHRDFSPAPEGRQIGAGDPNGERMHVWSCRYDSRGIQHSATTARFLVGRAGAAGGPVVPPDVGMSESLLFYP